MEHVSRVANHRPDIRPVATGELRVLDGNFRFGNRYAQ
jgi:hypothetical protein